MSDQDRRNKLQNLFRLENRYNNFGEVLNAVLVHGFRCHSQTFIEFESPITAFCGLNGTGKSTLLQILACAYQNPDKPEERYYIKDFIVTGTLDPEPFSSDANVEFFYHQEDRSRKSKDLYRDVARKRWQGYRKQPSRSVYFAGIGLYLPRIEKRDFIVQNASKIKISNTKAIPERSKSWISKVLSCSYDAVNSHIVEHNTRQGEIVTLTRYGATYSETHMGYGEGRLQHIIHDLETLPRKSLVILEEPETSLHPSAQYELGSYLVDVCIDRGHQLFISTHSKYLLTALPTESRVYLERTPNGLRAHPKISTSQAVSLMTGGRDKALHILVEDDVAEAVLTELLRRGDQTFLKVVKVHIGGDTDILQKTMKIMNEAHLPVIAVRDGDKQGNVRENIFKLPGDLPPEKELFRSLSVQNLLREKYGVEVNDFLAGMYQLDHHKWLDNLAALVQMSRSALIQEAAKAYVYGLPENDVILLAESLKGTLRI